MIAARQAERLVAPPPPALKPGSREAEVFEPPLHLRPGQGWPKWRMAVRIPSVVSRARSMPRVQRPVPTSCRPRPLAPGIDIGEHLLDEREVSSQPCQSAQMKPMAASPAGTTSCSVQVGVGPTILSRGKPTWAASFRAVAVKTPLLRKMTQPGWATLTRSQVAFWSSPGV